MGHVRVAPSCKPTGSSRAWKGSSASANSILHPPCLNTPRIGLHPLRHPSSIAHFNHPQLFLCPSRQGLFIIELEQRYSPHAAQQQQLLHRRPPARAFVIAARICRLHYCPESIFSSRPRLCLHVRRRRAVYPGFCRLANSHTTAASCCPPPVPLTACCYSSSVVFSRRLRQLVARASTVDTSTLFAVVCAVLLPSPPVQCPQRRVPRVRCDVAAPYFCRLPTCGPTALDIATPQRPARVPRPLKPFAGELRRSSGRPLCPTRACRATRTRRACAMESPSPPPSRHQSQRRLSAT